MKTMVFRTILLAMVLNSMIWISGCATGGSNPFNRFSMCTFDSTWYGRAPDGNTPFADAIGKKTFSAGQPVLLRIVNYGDPKTIVVKLVNTSTGQMLVDQPIQVSGGGVLGSIGMWDTIMTNLPPGNYSWLGQTSNASAVWNFQVLQ